MFALWAAGFAVLGLLVYVFGRMEVSSDDRAALQLMRKSFHFVALFMFMPAGFYNVRPLCSRCRCYCASRGTV